MFGWKKRCKDWELKYRLLWEKHDALEEKYDELCAMDCQKLYGEERHKRVKAEHQAAALKAKADSLDEMRIITNAWLATTVEVAGGIEIPADRLKANIERGAEPIVTYDSEREIYKLKMVDVCEAE